MSRTSLVYLNDILECIELIEQYTQDLNSQAFLALIEKQDAVIRRLEIIGEATRHLAGEFSADYPSVPWSRIIGMRNRLIHEYGRVDLELTWTVVERDLPELKRQIRKILDQIEG